MVKLLDRVKQSVAGTAASTTLGAASEGFRTFNTAGAATNDVCRYAIEDDSGAFEIGTIVINSATTGTRTVQISSNSNNALTLTGNAVIFATLSAADFSGNAEPAWSTTPPSTLDLANDGSTAVTLAGVAIDEFPVHYSWDGYSGTTVYNADSLPPQLASAPTFSGGTASLIGSSTASNAGSFNFRLKASDGVKTATAITAVNLSFFPPASGLIAYYDVANNQSYGGSGTTWSDVSGNGGPDLTLSSVTYNSSGIGAEPSFSISTLHAVKTTSSLGSSTTLVAIMQVTMTDDTKRVILFDNADSGSDESGIYVHKDETYHPALNANAGYRFTSNDNTQANTLFIDKVDMVNSTRGDVANKLYVNSGASAKMHSVVLQTADLSNGFSTQSRKPSSYAVLTGQIRALLFYSRTLSTTEVGEIHDHYSAIYGNDMP